MRIENLDGIKSYLDVPKNIVVTNHVNPDGDAMGSALALSNVLKKLGHIVNVIVPNEYPHFLKWLPGDEDVIVYNNNIEQSKDYINRADLVIVLDYNALHRSGELEETLTNFSGNFLMIDHHQQPGDFARWMVSDTSKCSTAQMVFEFVSFLGKEDVISLDAALNIYTGIVTDTGSFRFSSTTSETHKIVAKLLELGVKPDTVYNNIFDANSVSRMKLLGSMLNDMKVFKAKKAVILYLTEKNQNLNNYRKGDSEGFVNYGLSIEGIQFSAFFREEKGRVKVSLRSKGELDVNQISRDNFNGGGHKNAAGGLLTCSLEEAINKAEQVINAL